MSKTQQPPRRRAAPVAKSSAKATPAPEVLTTQPEAGDSLAQAVRTLFTEASDSLVLRDGRVVEISAAKTKHLSLLLDFFNALLAAFTPEQVVKLVTLLETRESDSKARRAYQIVLANENSSEELRNAALSELGKIDAPKTLDSIVAEAFDKSSLIVTIAQATLDVMPKLAAAMTTLTAEEFGDLDLDEGSAVTLSIFGMNYGFFSRNLPALFRSFIGKAVVKATVKK